MSSTAVIGAGTGPARILKPWDLWVFVLPILAMLPLLLVEWQHLMNRPERQFFPILVAIALYFPLRCIWEQQDQEQAVSSNRLRAALTVFTFCFLAFVVAVWKFSPWLTHLAAIGTFCAWCLGRFPNLPWSRCAAWTGLLLVTLPLPFGYDDNLVTWLQRASATACGNALDALNVPHMRTANIIEILGRQLFVEEACSGIGSLYALLAAAALLLLLNGRSFLCTVLVIATVPIWAILGNFLRLLTIALAQEYYQRDLSHGWDHELLGILTFTLAALGLWMTEWLFSGLLRPLPPSTPEFNFAFQTINTILCWPEKDPMSLIEDSDDENEEERLARLAHQKALQESREAEVPRVRLWEQKFVRVLAKTMTVFMLLLGILLAYVVFSRDTSQLLSFGLPEYTAEQLTKFPAKDSMPEELQEWKLVNFGKETRSTANAMGAHSLIWEYRKADQKLLCSMDFPFRGFHALEVCYRNAGWTVDSLDGVSDTASSQPWDWREITMNNQFGSRGFVCYSLMTETCQPFGSVNLWDRDRKIVDRLTAENSNIFRTSPVFTPVCYQIQMVCETGRELDSSEKANLRELFKQIRESLKSKIKVDEPKS